jgi:hypothetical protein
MSRVADLAESDCSRHGLDEHVCVHEAGHAAAAIDNGIPFKRIAIYGTDGGATIGGFWRAVAGVEMLSEDPATWVLPDRKAALQFVLAGSLAEVAVLGHALEDGYRGDVAAWRRGVGRTDAMTLEELDMLVGVPFGRARAETQQWADASKERIRRLADHLTRLPAPAEMPYAEVVSLLAVASPGARPSGEDGRAD